MLFCCVIMEDREDDLADVVQIEEERQTDGRTDGQRERVEEKRFSFATI